LQKLSSNPASIEFDPHPATFVCQKFFHLPPVPASIVLPPSHFASHKEKTVLCNEADWTKEDQSTATFLNALGYDIVC
jgi:hypothetical protein